MLSEKASGIASNESSDPPSYNEVVKPNYIPSAPQLEPSFSSIFGVANTVQFEWNSSNRGVVHRVRNARIHIDSGFSFLIRDNEGSLQAKGDVTNQNTVVKNVNGLEMLKIVQEGVDEMIDRTFVRKFNVIHEDGTLGTVKVVEKAPPRTSLQIFDRNESQFVVNSLKIGDYAIFRDNLSSTPLCNIQMPNVECHSNREFNVKIIFHLQTGITHDEQLLCTAAAIAFKTTMKEMTNIIENEDECYGYFCRLACGAILGLVLLVAIIANWNNIV